MKLLSALVCVCPWLFSSATKLRRGFFRKPNGDKHGSNDDIGLTKTDRRCGSRFEQCRAGVLPSCWSEANEASVSFAIVTGKAYTNRSDGRPWAQRATWLSAVQQNSWAYFSDEPDPRLPAYQVKGTAGGWKASQRKWLGILERLAAEAPPFDDAGFFPQGAEWLFIADDDTFVYPDTLMYRLGKISPDNEGLYLGLPDRAMAMSVGLDLGDVDSYCLGGAGFALNRKLAADLKGTDIKASCAAFFDNGAHADIAFAQCLSQTLGIKRCERLAGLNQSPFPFLPSGSGDGMFDSAEGDFPNCAPATFHWMKPEQMRRLWAKTH